MSNIIKTTSPFENKSHAHLLMLTEDRYKILNSDNSQLDSSVKIENSENISPN